MKSATKGTSSCARQLAGIVFGALLVRGASSFNSYSNVTLTSFGGDLSVVVFLPNGIKPDERPYYYSSRFEHGSMIGKITRKTARGGEHVLFDWDMWRMPHNANWPESGIGLASEFGVGDDGAFCFYRCGWEAKNDVTNGVLGYREAKNGESFLKIGVGELIKGTCPICDSTEDYRFNSPYLFRKPPQWKIIQQGEAEITLEHEAVLNNHGYRLVKETKLIDNSLYVTSTLTNLGTQAFSTAWYSHNFFTCDGNAVGPGYSIDLSLKKGKEYDPVYEEPGTWSWATPIEEYADVVPHDDHITVDMVRALEPGVRIKTEFVKDGATKGAFAIHACGTTLESSFPQLDDPGWVQATGVTMYAYNLYLERATLSPEPQILINLDPGASTTWTQLLVIKPEKKEENVEPEMWLSFLLTNQGALPSSRGGMLVTLVFVAVSSAVFAQLIQKARDDYQRSRRRQRYSAIPDNGAAQAGDEQPLCAGEGVSSEQQQ